MDHYKIIWGTELERLKVVEEARTWLWTPFVHRSAVKEAGVDCAFLLWAVFSKLGHCSDEPPRFYTPDWFLHNSEERAGREWFLEQLEFYNQVEVQREPRPGDIVVVKVGRAFAHGAIVTKWPMVIQAWPEQKNVAEVNFELDLSMVTRERKLYTVNRWRDLEDGVGIGEGKSGAYPEGARTSGQ